MPRHSAEPIRRAAIVKATIQEVARAGSLEVTVAQIAGKAGVSSALAHHYFGSKEAIFVAAMRHVLTVFGAEVRGALATADSPRERVEAIVRASFSAGSFRREVIAAWLNFYVLAQTMPEARRLLSLYRRRLKSNLVHSLRPMVGDRADQVAEGLGALIDGVYLRQALAGTSPDRQAAAQLVLNYLSREVAA
ncbi:choline-binding transcriptional repressor BetI [Rubellimicrobium roseum]|uniref:HTH-type transcriptional regulator BetI n=1 Tax=Rubellimicrobium roseum TaxID=687525 RepID=A0A5C4NE65_9RHOB|nr:transcriptional regulator BetI [Rubellimicrobium roseum]TNC73044.1 transcriptional regulator BetI [Rubellimicrobium roseum]